VGAEGFLSFLPHTYLLLVLLSLEAAAAADHRLLRPPEPSSIGRPLLSGALPWIKVPPSFISLSLSLVLPRVRVSDFFGEPCASEIVWSWFYSYIA
jgi:hypothetical protein